MLLESSNCAKIRADNTHFVRVCKGGIAVWLIYCLTGLDLARQPLFIEHNQSNFILTNKTGVHLYCETTPYKVSECSLFGVFC